MVISVSPNDAEQAIDSLDKEHINASVIGFFSQKIPDEPAVHLIG